MKYWKSNYNGLIKYIASNNPTPTWVKWTELTKEEYDQAVTIPNLTQDNQNHNYFSVAELALRKEKQRYQNSLFSIDQVTLEAVVPLGKKFVTNVRHLTEANKVLYNNFNAYLKEAAEVDLQRAITYYDGEIALSAITDKTVKAQKQKELETKVQGIIVDLSNIEAMNGKNEFFAWLAVEHPELRDYVNKVESLKYTTMLTEDEPQ